MKKYPTKHKGFVILFTILISTIILLIGLGIFSIATRETVLSGTAREAQYAFYAADAGVECALYAQSLGVLGNGGGSFECGQISATVSGTGQYPGFPFVFNIIVDSVRKTCARVTVVDTFTSSGAQARRIVSQGYNICSTDGKPLTKNPILVERDLDVMYQIGGDTGIVGNPSPSSPAKDPLELTPGSIDPGVFGGILPPTNGSIKQPLPLSGE